MKLTREQRKLFESWGYTAVENQLRIGLILRY